VATRVLISAGEASGDLYAAGLVEALHRRNPGMEFFGCAGPRMQSAGVRAVVDAASISVVGLVEVVTHIPRIWREYRKLLRAAIEQRPEIAILTDSPDFHLRLARRLKALQIPVIYLIAPQVWAWRKGRLPLMRANHRPVALHFPVRAGILCFQWDKCRLSRSSLDQIGAAVGQSPGVKEALRHTRGNSLGRPASRQSKR